jgi:inositol phosphorylceramide synthase catalytic subunit
MSSTHPASGLWRTPRQLGVPWLIAPFVVYGTYALLRGDLRFDHLAVLGIVVLLAYAGPRTEELLRGLYPLGLVFLLYDGMRPYQRLGLSASRVLLCDLRAVESRLFGWSDGSTLHDYWQVHASTALDLLCAVPYATFLLWCAVGAILLHVKDRAAMKRFMWGFFLLNAAGFVTYHLLPAAPPWYFHAHGCVVDLATKANEGPALARVDALIGVAYFHGMYAKASSVFGAMPSLHCAYPLLLAIEGWRAFGTKLRIAGVAYYVAMVFSAVYLDHHWVLDAIAGSAFSIAVAGGMRLVEHLRTGERVHHTQQAVQ